MIQDIKIYILIVVLIINISCQNHKQTSIENDKNNCDSTIILNKLKYANDTIKILKNMLLSKRYYEYSKFKQESGDNDSSLFAKFTNSITEVNAPININIVLMGEDEIKKNDSMSFIIGDSGKILNGRIISNDCDYQNELTIMLPYFLNIHSKYYPYISGMDYKDVGFNNKHKFFATNKNEKESFIFKRKEYFNAIMINNRIKIRENQKFYLFHLTISKTRQGEICGYPLLCTFQSDGELIDCLSLPSCKSGGTDTDSIDSHGFFYGSICKYWLQSEKNEYYEYNKCLNYIIRITDNGYFKLVKYDVKTNKNKQE